MGWEGNRLLRLISLLLLAMVAAILLVGGTGEANLRLLIRATARSSLLLFLLAFTASSAVRLVPSPATRWALRNRRSLGLGFAISHAWHLAAIVTGAWLHRAAFTADLTPVAVVGGGITYAFIAAMALTSSDAAQAFLGRARWRRLHVVGSYVIWIVFAQSYVGRAVVAPEYLPYALVVVGALVLRLMPRFKTATA
jgi:hypothetical protein